jgi:hypothetical protein
MRSIFKLKASVFENIYVIRQLDETAMLAQAIFNVRVNNAYCSRKFITIITTKKEKYYVYTYQYIRNSVLTAV